MNIAFGTICILLLGLVLDFSLGEPPAWLHPVVWMGQVISFLVKIKVGQNRYAQFCLGLAIVFVSVGIFVTPVYFLFNYFNSLSWVAYIIVGALFFKTTFSLKGLRQASKTIKTLLSRGNLAQARFELRSLVGRDTSTLDQGQMISSTIESVAENSCDSFVAPLFYFLLLGMPGAVAYRVINTLDAMIGHHGQFEYLGKFAAKLDTVANFIPARITALVIICAAWICRRNISKAWYILWRDRKNTESPNAGWPMSAMAGVLGVQLEKVGFYKLGDNQNSLSLSLIDASWRIVATAAILYSLLLILSEVICHAAT